MQRIFGRKPLLAGRFRRIRTSRLLVSGVVYRVLVVLCDMLFFVVGLEPALEHYGLLGAAVLMNVVSLIVYYAYHFSFAKLFRLGRNSC